MSVTGCAPLEEMQEPRLQWLNGGSDVLDGASKKFVSICGFLLAEAASDSPYLLVIVLVPLDELGR